MAKVIIVPHMKLANAPITVLLYSGALLCGFNLLIKRLS